MTSRSHSDWVAGMSPDEIIARLRDDGAADFDKLAAAIVTGPDGTIDTTILCVPWSVFASYVATVLAVSGKSIDDLAAAINARRGATP